MRPPWGGSLPSHNCNRALAAAGATTRRQTRTSTPALQNINPRLTTALSRSQIMDLICILDHALKCLKNCTLFATRAQ